MLQHHIAIYAIMSMTKKILSPWPLSKRRGEIPVSSYVPLQCCQWTPPLLGGGWVEVKGILMHILLPRPTGTRCRQACFSSSLGIAKASFSSAQNLGKTLFLMSLNFGGLEFFTLLHLVFFKQIRIRIKHKYTIYIL